VTSLPPPSSRHQILRALAGDLGGLAPHAWTGPAPLLPPGLRVALLVTYYVAVLGGLAWLYGSHPPSPPPFIYQGF
jgi:hypothetical protein